MIKLRKWMVGAAVLGMSSAMAPARCSSQESKALLTPSPLAEGRTRTKPRTSWGEDFQRWPKPTAFAFESIAMRKSSAGSPCLSRLSASSRELGRSR